MLNEKEKKSLIRKLKIARGQVDGIIGMIEDDRYCIDISTQLLAASSILKNVNKEILNSHLETCVKKSVMSDSEEDKSKKLKEIEDILNIILK